MDYNMIEEKVKAFCENQLKEAKKIASLEFTTKSSIRYCRAIAYGAVQFATNNLFPSYNVDLANWWTDFREKFTEVENEIVESVGW